MLRDYTCVVPLVRVVHLSAALFAMNSDGPLCLVLLSSCSLHLSWLFLACLDPLVRSRAPVSSIFFHFPSFSTCARAASISTIDGGGTFIPPLPTDGSAAQCLKDETARVNYPFDNPTPFVLDKVIHPSSYADLSDLFSTRFSNNFYVENFVDARILL